ncbi:MAG: hypothetical protein QME66_00660 [Candidatus Eisenbacteria bacterium]|nr:hypothetical protein [Candidatus Eisenbacteria bacterium]
MASNEKEKKEEIADDIFETVDKIIPGFGSFFKKGEKSEKFGDRMRKIREEINKRFGGMR